MTKLQLLIEILQKDEDESIQGLEQLIIDNFYNQEQNEYVIDGTTYYILNEDEVQELLDEQFENDLYSASELLERRYYEISNIVRNLDSSFNHLRAHKDAPRVEKYLFIDQTEDGNYYIYTD